MGTRRGVRKGWDFVDPKPLEAGCGLQKIIMFLSSKKCTGSPKGIKGGMVHSAAKGLAVMHAARGDLGPGITGSRGQAMVGGAGLANQATHQPCHHLLCDLGQVPLLP